MAKGKRLTVRLDDELDAVIEQACVDGNCDKAAAVRDAIRKGFGLTDDHQAHVKPIPKGVLVDLDTEKPIVKGTLRWAKSYEIGKVPFARAIHHLDRSGKPLWSDHYDENGKFQYRQQYRSL